MKNKTIIVDVDDTIVHYTPAFFSFHGHHDLRDGYYKDYVHYFNSVMNDDRYDVDRVQSMVECFNTSPAFAKLKPLPNAREALHELYRRGYDLHVVSSCGNHVLTERYRKENLKAEFGDIFKHVHLLPTLAPKREILAQYDPEHTVLIEDNASNYLHARDLGMHSVLVDSKFTRIPEDAFVCDDWREIFEHVVTL